MNNVFHKKPTKSELEKANFAKELEFGNSYEKKLVKYLKPSLYAYNDDNEYDVQMVFNGVVKRYEVKADRMMARTGNFFIEFECNNKPSGISVSKADIYAYFEVGGGDAKRSRSGIYNKLYLIPKEYIFDMINKKAYKRIVNGGDGGRAKSYLFSKDTFRNFEMS